jgi:hypothetical protein
MAGTRGAGWLPKPTDRGARTRHATSRHSPMTESRHWRHDVTLSVLLLALLTATAW